MRPRGPRHREAEHGAPLLREGGVSAAVEVRVPRPQVRQLHVVDEARRVAQRAAEALVHLCVRLLPPRSLQQQSLVCTPH